MTPKEQEVRVDVEGRTLKLSNLDKVLFPRTISSCWLGGTDARNRPRHPR